MQRSQVFYIFSVRSINKYSMDVIFWNGGIDWGLSRSIGPYKVAHWVRKHNYTAQVIDFIDKISEDVLYNITKKFINPNTIVLGLSTTFLSLTLHTHSDGHKRNIAEHILNVLKRIKLENPNIKIVLGGYQSDTIQDYGVIDATIMSYDEASEDIFIEYLDYLSKNSIPPQSYDYSNRPVYHKANNPKYNIEVDDFKFTKQDCILRGEPLPLDVSRGCIFKCSFCRYPHLGKKKFDYVRGMNYLKEEMLNNYHEFGTTSYLILDDTFNDTEIKMQLFHSMVKSLPFEITYTAYLRADLIHRYPNMTHYLKDSGLFGAFFGLESLHPVASKIVGKAWSGKHAKEYIPELYHSIWKGQVPIHTNFIVGLTGDTQENINDTAKWFIQNKLHSINFECLGLYGPDQTTNRTIKSDLDKDPSKYGYTLFYADDNISLPTWKNDAWTLDSAFLATTRARAAVRVYDKIRVWSIPIAMWYGADKKFILSKTTANNYSTFAKTTADKLNEYINLLMKI